MVLDGSVSSASPGEIYALIACAGALFGSTILYGRWKYAQTHKEDTSTELTSDQKVFLGGLENACAAVEFGEKLSSLEYSPNEKVTFRQRYNNLLTGINGAYETLKKSSEKIPSFIETRLDYFKSHCQDLSRPPIENLSS